MKDSAKRKKRIKTGVPLNLFNINKKMPTGIWKQIKKISSLF